VKEVAPVPPRDTSRVPVVSPIAIPSEEVASCCHEPPAYEPRRMPAADGFWMPVPPLEAARAPERVRVPMLAEVEKRFVDEAVVEKREVVVAEVPVALVKVKF
jgi:hypothetical protein